MLWGLFKCRYGKGKENLFQKLTCENIFFSNTAYIINSGSKVWNIYLYNILIFWNIFKHTLQKIYIFAAERWQSGLLRRSWKPLRVIPPGVRIPISPPNKKGKAASCSFFYLMKLMDKFYLKCWNEIFAKAHNFIEGGIFALSNSAF